MDDNFSVAPAQFSPLYYVLCIPLLDIRITGVYTLLQNESSFVYDELFQAVIDRLEGYRFEMILQTGITNLEEDVLRAVAGVFGRGMCRVRAAFTTLHNIVSVIGRDVQSEGCFYHLTQNIWR